MIDIDNGFSTDEMCFLAGVTFRQLDYWCRAGAIEPSISDAAGSGTRRRWSSDDADALHAIITVARDLAAVAPGNISRDFVRRLWDTWHAAESDAPITLDVGTVSIKLR